MNHVKKITLACLTAVSLLSAGPALAGPVKAVASFSILGDMVRNVGGDLVALHVIVGPDGDAHVYEPRPEDARKVAAADVVFVNGLGFEGWMERVVEAAGSRAPIIEASTGIATIAFAGGEHHEHETDGQTAKHEEGHEAVDPHAWQSVANAKIYVGNIAKALCAADPENCPAYQANAGRYADDLAALDREIRGAVARTPSDRRRVISNHDAFGYFAKEYGITFLAPEGVFDGIGGLGSRRGESHPANSQQQGGGDLRRKHQRPAAHRADRAGDRHEGRRRALFRCPVGRRRPGCHVHRNDALQRPHHRFGDRGGKLTCTRYNCIHNTGQLADDCEGDTRGSGRRRLFGACRTLPNGGAARHAGGLRRRS